MNKVFYSFGDLQSDLTKIIRQIYADNFRPVYVVGITRGGLIPAVMLSHFLRTKFASIHVSFEDEWNYDISNLKFDGNILIIDDIVDGGNHMRQVRRLIIDQIGEERFYQEIKFASLIYNIARENIDVDYYAREINRYKDDSSIEFFFETLNHPNGMK